MTMASVLSSLGEDIPNNAPQECTDLQVDLAADQFEKEADDSLLNSNQSISKHQMAVMQAYYTLVSIAYVARPKLYPHYVTCWARFHLNHKITCEYTPGKCKRRLSFFFFSFFLIFLIIHEYCP